MTTFKEEFLSDSIKWGKLHISFSNGMIIFETSPANSYRFPFPESNLDYLYENHIDGIGANPIKETLGKVIEELTKVRRNLL